MFYLLLLLISTVLAAYDSNAKNNVAVYWGQGANQQILRHYCDSGNVDIAVISFITHINATYVAFNFGNACSGPECPLIAVDIAYCQSLEIKVLVSMGGGGGDTRMSGFHLGSDSGGEAAAHLLYDMFNLNGNSKVTKPFGSTQIDGFDFDVEDGDQTGQIALSAKLKSLWPGIFISACPQCLYPDKNVGELISSEKADVDFVFLQFYSNDGCSMIYNTFFDSWNTCANFFENVTKAKNAKMYISLQGDEGNKYHTNLTFLNSQVGNKKLADFVGGFGVWDATVASNTVDISTGKSMDYLKGLKYVASGVYNNIYNKRDEL